MENQMETLREELNKLINDSVCLHSDKIVKLSQELDNLICKYYQNSIAA